MIVVLLWSTIASAFKISLRVIDFLQLLFYASLFSLLTLFIVVVVKKKLPLLRACRTKDYATSALLGFLNPFLYYVVLLKAYTLLPAQQAVALNYTWAIQLVILSVPILKQKIRFRNIIAIVISYVGVLIISTQGNVAALHITNVEGTLLALGSAVIWALFWIYNVKDKRDAVVKLSLNFLFGFAYIFIYVMITQRIEIPALAGLIGALYVRVFEMGITFVLWLTALRLSKTTAQVSNLIYLTPFLALLFINIFVGESIFFSTVIGLFLIIAGIILQRYPLREHITKRL